MIYSAIIQDSKVEFRFRFHSKIPLTISGRKLQVVKRKLEDVKRTERPWMCISLCKLKVGMFRPSIEFHGVATFSHLCVCVWAVS